MDEASLYLQATTMAVWAPKGHEVVVRCDASRKKTSFYGTLDLKTGREIVREAETLNAQTTADYLEDILTTYPDRPVLLLWDKAPWHHGPAIQALLDAHPRLELMTFPTASPDLNPQEHVWRATRRAVSHNHTQSRLPDLARQFKEHLVSSTFESSFLDKYGWSLVCPGFT
jgi:transposase